MKIQSVFVLLGIMILAIVVIVSGIKGCNKNTYNGETNKKVFKLKWELCWLNLKTSPSQTQEHWNATGMCGDMKEIRFDEEGEVLSMTVYFFSTKITTKFFRKKGDEKGRWTQPGGDGWWTLKQISPDNFEGECQGGEKGEKILKIILSLKK